jgi:hypothetical protein
MAGRKSDVHRLECKLLGLPAERKGGRGSAKAQRPPRAPFKRMPALVDDGKIDGAKDAFGQRKKIRLIPPRSVTREEALSKLQSLLGSEVKRIADLLIADLGIPHEVKLMIYPDGIEIYDTDTLRPYPRCQSEQLSQIELWTHHWYFSAFQDGDGKRMMGRYVNKDPGSRLPRLEQLLRDPDSRQSRYSLESFASSVVYGDEPD